MALMRAAHDYASTASAKRILTVCQIPSTQSVLHFTIENHMNRGIKSIDRKEKHHPIVASYRHRSTVQVPQ